MSDKKIQYENHTYHCSECGSKLCIDKYCIDKKCKMYKVMQGEIKASELPSPPTKN